MNRSAVIRNVLCLAAFALVGTVVPVQAIEPGKAALAFLVDLRDEGRALDELLNDSMLSAHTGEIRRSVISQRLGRVGRYLRDNHYELEVTDEKRDGDLAAVILTAVSRHDPLEVDVFALGLREKKDVRWRVAPVPGSFDNVDLGYDEALEKRAEVLELWMGAERLVRLRALHEEVLGALRERMNGAVPRARIEGAGPVQLVTAFVEACREGDLPAAMVLLGQFEGELTEEDRRLQRVISRGLQGLDRRGYWHLLTSPDVVRVAVQEDGGDDLDAEVLLLIFDPDRGKPVSLVRFVLLYAGKRWTIELPNGLRLADADRVTFQRALLREQDYDEDNEFRNKFEKQFEEQHEPSRAATLKEAGVRIGKILKEGSLGDFFRFVHRSEDLSGSERRTAYRYLGAFWNEFQKNSKAASDGKLLEVIEHGDAGVLVFQLISTAQNERLSLTPLVLIRDENGWAISPGVTTGGNYAKLDEGKRGRQGEVRRRFEEQKDELTRKATTELLSHFVEARAQEGKVVGEREAGQLVRKFRNLLREGKLLESFECGSLLDPEEGVWEALKAMSYEYRGARQSSTPDREIQVKGGKAWAAVTLRVDSGPGLEPNYPMYLVVATTEGPRIVVDVGLRLATNKGREVLNKRVWERIDAHLEEQESALVRTLFEGHVEQSKMDLSEWEKSNKLSP